MQITNEKTLNRIKNIINEFDNKDHIIEIENETLLIYNNFENSEHKGDLVLTIQKNKNHPRENYISAYRNNGLRIYDDFIDQNFTMTLYMPIWIRLLDLGPYLRHLIVRLTDKYVIYTGEFNA